MSLQQMEKFKACEKEMKTKAFSKDGLAGGMKLDPKEKEKAETGSWITAQVDELSRQIEASEAEVESLQAVVTKKKTKSSQSSRLEELETFNDRRKWHIGRLEIILRLLENGALSTERVLELKDSIQYFIESNTVRRAAVVIADSHDHLTYIEFPGRRFRVRRRHL